MRTEMPCPFKNPACEAFCPFWLLSRKMRTATPLFFRRAISCAMGSDVKLYIAMSALIFALASCVMIACSHPPCGEKKTLASWAKAMEEAKKRQQRIVAAKMRNIFRKNIGVLFERSLWPLPRMGQRLGFCFTYLSPLAQHARNIFLSRCDALAGHQRLLVFASNRKISK